VAKEGVVSTMNPVTDQQEPASETLSAADVPPGQCRLGATADDAEPVGDEADLSSDQSAGSSSEIGGGEARDAVEKHRPPEPPPEIHPHRVVEAVLFAADSPMPAAKIASVLGVGDARDVRRYIDQLNGEYVSHGQAFRIEHIAGGYQMLTLPAYNTWLGKLLRARQETRLSPAALETLAIVAYKQPCTRADIEAIRGVAAGDLLNRLREMNLVKIVGRAEDLGRPLLYGTTKRFLEVFGLPSLEELPQVEALSLGPGGSARGAIAVETEKAAEESVAGTDDAEEPPADHPPVQNEPAAEEVE
jgi:segregation and condensation protein B